MNSMLAVFTSNVQNIVASDRWKSQNQRGVAATEEKSWWRGGWEAVSSWGADTSMYTANVPAYLLVVAVSVAVPGPRPKGAIVVALISPTKQRRDRA